MRTGLVVLLWIIGIVFLLLTAFAILQPFLWHLIFNEEPADLTIKYSNILIIMITLLTLGVAALGAMTYYVINQRIQENIQRLQGDINRTTAQCLDDISTNSLNLQQEIRTAYTNFREDISTASSNFQQEIRKTTQQDYIIAMAKHYSSMCLLWGSLYETLFNILKEAKLEEDKLPLFKYCIDYSLNNGKKAIELTKKLDKDRHRDTILEAKNNYAMALALNGDQGTGIIAEELIIDLEKAKKEYKEEDFKYFALEETINFLRWRIPRKSDDSELAEQNLAKLLNSPFYKDTPREEYIRQRWKRFSKPEV